MSYLLWNQLEEVETLAFVETGHQVAEMVDQVESSLVALVALALFEAF